MHKRSHHIYIYSIALLATVLACNPGGRDGSTRQGPVQIVATTGMVADAIANIAGDSASVTAIMGPGVDPHLYKATQGDLRLLTGAHVVFYNGLHLEGKMTDIFEKMSRMKPVIALGDGLPRSVIKQSTQYENAPDPHIWFDVALWKQAVAYASEQLQKIDTANAPYYRGNTRRYLNRLDSLDRAVRTAIHSIPPEQRVLITAHDAFGYFGSAYDIEVRGLQGISTLSEYGLRDITDLVDFIIERKIKSVFLETSVPEKAIRAVVEGCREKGHEITIGGSLFSDAMGEAGTPEGTYIGMVDSNVRTIVNALK